jgi:RimJ/RimL family protein N-acetyltransferase
MTRPVLTTERLRLEPLTLDHTDDLVALDADPEVVKHVFGRRLTREEVVRDWMPKRTSPAAHARGLGYWVGYADDRFVGWWLLGVDDEDDRVAEIGYRLRRDAWGRGFATEGGRALLAHAFDTLGLDRVWAEAMVVNDASRRVLAKLGLREVRIEHGEWPWPAAGAEEGQVFCEITRREYDERRVG